MVCCGSVWCSTALQSHQASAIRCAARPAEPGSVARRITPWNWHATPTESAGSRERGGDYSPGGGCAIHLSCLIPSQFPLFPASRPTKACHTHRNCRQQRARRGLYGGRGRCRPSLPSLRAALASPSHLAFPPSPFSPPTTLGMPYPQNLHAAEGVEGIIRREGAVPATIAIIDGRPCIGLTASQLQHLARDGHAAVKTARRDVALVVSQGLTGATTVSATMLLAHKVGISVFATGGIGGVHRRGGRAQTKGGGQSGESACLCSLLRFLPFPLSVSSPQVGIPVFVTGGIGGVHRGGEISKQRVGIPVFVTGGIGGVHRGGESTMDISSDLTELGRTRVAVVCAGVKSVLDIPRTLEYLETQGVTVVVYGAKEFPAFFTATSGCPPRRSPLSPPHLPPTHPISLSLNPSPSHSPHLPPTHPISLSLTPSPPHSTLLLPSPTLQAPATLSDPASCAALIDTNHRMKLNSGMVIAVPVPQGQAAEAEEVERATQQALAEADAQGVKGAQVTPFVLKRIKELTGGASLTANIALVKNNARVGAQIACALAQRRMSPSPTFPPLLPIPISPPSHLSPHTPHSNPSPSLNPSHRLSPPPSPPQFPPSFPTPFPILSPPSPLSLLSYLTTHSSLFGSLQI
ncbi:unnamed protein product, partial [Closterium sp. NIES-65]